MAYGTGRCQKGRDFHLRSMDIRKSVFKFFKWFMTCEHAIYGIDKCEIVNVFTISRGCCPRWPAMNMHLRNMDIRKSVCRLLKLCMTCNNWRNVKSSMYLRYSEGYCHRWHDINIHLRNMNISKSVFRFCKWFIKCSNWRNMKSLMYLWYSEGCFPCWRVMNINIRNKDIRKCV